MPPCFTGAVRDSLSNLAASLGAGKDKAANDSFVLFELERGQIEAMHRGDWLARKVIDIVPSDMVREWRAWSGHPADVARVEAAERRLGLRKAVQRAMVLGRLYGGGALLIGTGETDPAALARPLDPDALPRGGVRFLHAVSRWQLSVPAIDRDPLSPWFGEALFYEVVAPDRGALRLHPSRVVRFLGNPLPDPSLGASVWSDSVLQALYDAVHAVALTTAGATSLMHEAKVDVVMVPNLSEHLSSADTTAQLSARFAYAAAMKSINNLLLLGDGETWARQRVDFAGLPEMVRTFLQVAAGAADIPVTRLLGQSPAGLSATGESDTRNYYDMIAARQELDLRPQLERLDRLILASEGLDPEALSFAFRPLWQMDAATAATVALTKAQATQIYAGLGLWPTATLARLLEAQLVEDGTYPGAEAVFAEAGAAPVEDASTGDFFPAGLGVPHYLTEPREANGRWTTGGGSRSSASIVLTGASEEEREEKKELRATGGPVPEVQSEDPPILKLVPGMTPHGPMSTVLMPIPPKGSSAQPSSVAPGLSEPQARTSLKPLTPFSPSSLLGEIAAPSTSGQEPSPRSHEDDEHSILRLFSSLFDGRQDETSALKDQLPPSISKHIIPGIIGPGPYAQQPIILQPGAEVTPQDKQQNNATGYTFGCHRCGARDPGTQSGYFILDHQLSTAINPMGWLQFGYPHCRDCSLEQGGHVRALKRAMKREGLTP